MGNLGHLILVKHSSCKSSTMTVWVSAVFSCVQTMLWLPAIFSLFIYFYFYVHTVVDLVCSCIQVLYGHHKKHTSALYLMLRKKSFTAPWTHTHVSTVHGFSAGHCSNWTIPATCTTITHAFQKGSPCSATLVYKAHRQKSYDPLAPLALMSNVSIPGLKKLICEGPKTR